MTYIPEDFAFHDNDFDGLRLCSVCGDRETTDDVCWSCRQQEMIDSGELDVVAGFALSDGDQEPDYDDCQIYGHDWRDDEYGCYRCIVCGETECD